MPFDGGREGGEGCGARGEVGFHGGEGVDCAAFYDVDDDVAEGWRVQEAKVGGVGYYGATEGVAQKEDGGSGWEGEEGEGVSKDVDEVG